MSRFSRGGGGGVSAVGTVWSPLSCRAGQDAAAPGEGAVGSSAEARRPLLPAAVRQPAVSDRRRPCGGGGGRRVATYVEM